MNAISSIGQYPGFNYQGAVRRNDGHVVSNQEITLVVSILSKNPDSLLYKELHLVNTDRDGRFSLIVGQGSVEAGALARVSWMSELYIKTEMDAGSGLESVGETRVLPVPLTNYAINASYDFNIEMEFAASGSNLIFCQGQKADVRLNLRSYKYDHEPVEIEINNSYEDIVISPDRYTSIIENSGVRASAITINVGANAEKGWYHIPVKAVAASGKERETSILIEVIASTLSQAFSGTYDVFDCLNTSRGCVDTIYYQENFMPVDDNKVKFNTLAYSTNGHSLLFGKIMELYGQAGTQIGMNLGGGQATKADPEVYMMGTSFGNRNSFSLTYYLSYSDNGTSVFERRIAIFQLIE